MFSPLCHLSPAALTDDCSINDPFRSLMRAYNILTENKAFKLAQFKTLEEILMLIILCAQPGACFDLWTEAWRGAGLFLPGHWLLWFFSLNQAAENPIISNNPITFPSDSAAQIQGWICGLARFTDRLLKREATMSNFLAACALPGFGVRGWHDHWEVG